MKAYVKGFFLRGLAFGGFGPIIAGIIFLVLDRTIADFSLGGTQVFIAILSTYALAFIHAGASIFYQIEHWPTAKSMLLHFGTLYLAYSGCYLVNAWIPFEPMVLAVFTAIFTAIYLLVWLTVVLSIRAASKRLNRKLK